MSTRAPARSLSLQVRLGVLTACVAALLLLLAALLEQTASLSGSAGSTAATGFVLIMALAATRIGAFHPFPRLGPANLVTTGRTALVTLVAALALETPSDRVATTGVVVASIAAALDGWDGWLARRTRMSSAFGSRFDMEIDALLILVLGIFVWRYNKAGAWVLLSGALRYAFIVAGLALDWFQRALPPSGRRKAVCVIQIVGLITAIAPVIPWPLSAVISALTLALLVWSFAVDTLWLWRARFVPNQA